MARQIINVGQQGNDGTGESIRSSFIKVNQNFSEIYGIFGESTIGLGALSDAPGTATFIITNVSSNGTTVTYTFTNDNLLNGLPFDTTSKVIIRNMIPFGYNGTFVVQASTTTTVTVNNTTTTSVSTYGNISSDYYGINQAIMSSTDGQRLTARTITSSDNTIIITNTNSALDIKVAPISAVTELSSDLAPALSHPLNANLNPFGRMVDPSANAVSLYNDLWGNLGTQTTTISQLPVTVNYGAQNYVKGVASNITAATLTTPAIAGTYTVSANLVTSAITSTGFIGPIGAGTKNTGGFTTLTATGTVSGTGFTTLFSSPTAFGNTTPNTGKFTSLTATTEVITPSITSGATTSLTIDSGTTGDLNIGTGSYSKGIVIGNMTTGTETNFYVGSTSSVNVHGALVTQSFNTNNIYTSQIFAGATTAETGTIDGQWTLTSGSTLNATYADLAENYEGDATYEPGTVLIFGGEKEVTKSTIVNDTRLAGVVTTKPAYTLNTDQSGIKTCIALVGRTPCKVIGRVKKGDLLTTSNSPGCAIKALEPKLGSIIGKALEDKLTGEVGVIEIAVGRS